MPLLQVDNVYKRFPVRSGLMGKAHAHVHAVNGVSLALEPGETLGIVGESGCGKSTLARLMVRLLDPDAGAIHFDGRDLTTLSPDAMRPLRREIQMIFQDPFSSLNPRMTVGAILAEPLIVHRVGSRHDRAGRVMEALALVGLPREAAARYPHEFSGGQRQRIGIARAVMLHPKLVVADEPVSALDVSVQGEILNLLLDLQDRLGLAYVFIAHDIKVVAQVSHRIAVMYLGKVVEALPAARLMDACHPYTRALLAAVPDPDPSLRKALVPVGGDVPSPMHLPSGCTFHPRCAYCQTRCRQDVPLLEAKPGDRLAACHYPVLE